VALTHTDAGVKVRRILHKLRSLANETFNEHFKSIFDVHEQVLTKCRVNIARFALGQCVATSWLYSTVIMSERWRSIVDSNRSSKRLDAL
jgi:hypothetical protein